MRSKITVEYLKYIHKYAIETTRVDELWLSDAVRSESDLYFICEKISSINDA